MYLIICLLTYLSVYLSLYLLPSMFINLFFFVVFFFSVPCEVDLCNDCGPKYKHFFFLYNFGLPSSGENCHCWKIPLLVLHDMSVNAIWYSICLLVTVFHCWIIFSFSSIISSLVNQRTFVFISSHSIDFRLFLLLISRHILIISSKLHSHVLTLKKKWGKKFF